MYEITLVDGSTRMVDADNIYKRIEPGAVGYVELTKTTKVVELTKTATIVFFAPIDGILCVREME